MGALGEQESRGAREQARAPRLLKTVKGYPGVAEEESNR